MRCRVALSGGAGGFPHADQQATSALFSRSTHKSGVFESFTHTYKNLGPFRPVYLSWTTPQKVAWLKQYNEVKGKKENQDQKYYQKKKKKLELEVLSALLTTYHSTP